MFRFGAITVMIRFCFFVFRDEELNGKANLREIGPDGFHWL